MTSPGCLATEENSVGGRTRNKDGDKATTHDSQEHTTGRNVTNSPIKRTGIFRISADREGDNANSTVKKTDLANLAAVRDSIGRKP